MVETDGDEGIRVLMQIASADSFSALLVPTRRSSGFPETYVDMEFLA
jgi:hypothetical protein